MPYEDYGQNSPNYRQNVGYLEKHDSMGEPDLWRNTKKSVGVGRTKIKVGRKVERKGAVQLVQCDFLEPWRKLTAS